MVSKGDNHLIFNSIGFNLKYDVHYPDIKITNPDESFIRKYYTCGFSGVTGNLSNPNNRYDCYHNSYDSVMINQDLDVQCSLHNEIYNLVQPIFGAPPNLWYQYMFSNTRYSEVCEALGKEILEYGDLMYYNYFQMYDNSWKRGYLTKEEFYNPIQDPYGHPVQRKDYAYTMTPIKTGSCHYKQGDVINPTYPGFITSGWVQLRRINIENGSGTAPYYFYTTNTEEMKYDNVNGLVKTKVKSFQGENGGGILQKIYFSYAYKYPEYDSMNVKHMWSQKVLTVVGDRYSTFSDTIQNNLNIASLNYVQWNNTLSGLTNQWYPWKIYNWQDADANKSCVQNELVKTTEIQSYDQYGNVINYIDANNIPTAAQWDSTASYPVAVTLNALPGECGSANIETADWNGWESGGAEIDYSISFTGLKSAYCSNDSGPTKNFYVSTTGISTNKSYIADAWIYRGNTSSIAKIAICIWNASGQYVSELTTSRTTGSNWQYIRVQINPAQMSGMTTGWYLRIRCGFPGTNNFGWVDDVRFYPINGSMKTNTVDLLTRQLTSRSDANNTPIKYTVDSFGCLNGVFNAEDSTLESYTYYFSRPQNGNEYNPDDPNYVQSVSMPNQFNGIIKKTYYDHLGREIQGQVKDSMTYIVNSTDYDAMSRVSTKGEPFYANTSNMYYPSIGLYTTDLGYDVLGRNTMLTHPDNTTIETAYRLLSSIGTTIETTNELGITNMEGIDYLGNKAMIINNYSEYWNSLRTEFQYDILGNLTKVLTPNYAAPPRGTSASNWDDTYKKYDTLGRLIEEYTQDADMVRYIYDNNNNLRFKQDKYQYSNNKYDFSAYIYDKQNRLILVGEETGTDWTLTSAPSLTGDLGTGASEWKIKYTYDVNSTPGYTNYSQGKLTKVEFNENTDNNPENVICFVYDKFGRLSKKQISMSGYQGSNTIQFFYDILGREIQIDYPSGNKVSKTYDSVGRLKKIIALQ